VDIFNQILAFVQANPIVVLVVAYLFLSGKITLASLVALFAGGKPGDDFLKKLLEQLLAAKSSGDKEAEEAIFKTMQHCVHCEHTAKK
jgi:hypothetical protein